MAEAANQQGGVFYKEGKFAKAQKCYQQAVTLDPKEPKYASNLSAVLYELGRYAACIVAIHLSWNPLRQQNGSPSTPPESDPLALKLATRFAKAKLNGISNKTISLHGEAPTQPNAVKGDQATKDLEADIEKFAILERDGNVDAKVKEMRSIWEEWRSVREKCSTHSANECQAAIAAAQTRFRAIPIFKKAADPTMEFYRIGHDPVQSLMYGLFGSTTDQYRLDGNPDYANQREWSFLFGGFGDARHVFGTLMHLAHMSTRGGKNVNLKVHLTLMDIHPAPLARNLVIFSLLDQIRLSKDSSKRVELHAALFYLYTSIIMPDYCHQIVMQTARSLAQELPNGTHSVCQFIHVNPKSLPVVLELLKYWSTPIPKSTKEFLKFKGGLGDLLGGAGGLGALADIFGSMMSPPKKQLTGSSSSSDAYADPSGESSLLDNIHVALPPRTLLARHPALGKLVRTHQNAPETTYSAVKREIEDTWDPNPTFFDKVSTEHPQFALPGGYPNVLTSPLETTISFPKFCREFQRSAIAPFARGNSGFAVTSQFFELAAEAITKLHKSLKVEVVRSDVITGVAKLFAGDLGERPKDFPVTFTRMFLSNVPDYTNGVLNTAVHLVPHLPPKGLAMANCLLNTASFPTISDFCYNYALLLPRDFPRILGCEVTNPHKSCFDDIALVRLPLPRPLDQLATKKELHTWLSQLLLATLRTPNSSPAPGRVDAPNNLTAFLHVLCHLHLVGFPSHWIGDFWQSVISNNFVTDVALYLGRLPVPSTEMNSRKPLRKVHLDAWVAELQVTMASAKLALPFSVALPSEWPSLEDIGTYKAPLLSSDLQLIPGHSTSVMMSAGSPFIKATGLMFYQPSKEATIDKLASRVHAILEGEPRVRDVKVQILLGQEELDLRQGGIVSWKMSKSWFEKMKEEKWVLAAYRTDLSIPGEHLDFQRPCTTDAPIFCFYFPATEPLSADKWLEVA
ncbi:hypothetical protein M413DRAFT_71143 [Hebeloma cylindrosporum]|uniref:DUF4470 domain-containing protein n=1 Tax=Hebeloma cylindrosporum TaxID=76867 RepID=A0A0C3BZ97_HEBCY|nr:hypothetical protein M413DRAFT_71143 [Hebeloma cylindrosporum h7]